MLLCVGRIMYFLSLFALLPLHGAGWMRGLMVVAPRASVLGHRQAVKVSIFGPRLSAKGFRGV